MPPTTRKAHTKSRHGCLQCKKRHLKCDEAAPTCGHCVRRRIQCSFDSIASTVASPADTPLSLGSETSTCGNDRTKFLSRTQTLDLMHFYSTRTYKTLSRGDFDTQFWRDVVPHEALTHEFLLDELFAVTCFHRASLDEDQPGHWIEMGIQYQTRGLTEFKKILTSIDVHNCGAAFAFASLTTFLAFADIGSGTPDVVSKVIETRNYMKGSGVIYHQAADSIQEGPMNALFRDVDGKDFSLIWNEEARRIHNSEQHNTDPHFMESFQRLYTLSGKQDFPEHYNHAIEILVLGYERAARSKAWSICIAWPIFIDDGFVNLLQQRDPLALLIAGHYGVTLHLLKDYWWCKDTGKRLVEGLAPRLAAPSPEWTACIEFIKQQVTTGKANLQQMPITPSSMTPGSVTTGVL